MPGQIKYDVLLRSLSIIAYKDLSQVSYDWSGREFLSLCTSSWEKKKKRKKKYITVLRLEKFILVKISVFEKGLRRTVQQLHFSPGMQEVLGMPAFLILCKLPSP